MRAIVCSLILGLFPALCLAETVQFLFIGYIGPGPNDNLPTFWNGPGPEPSTFQMTFDVNTLSPLNSVSYTFGASPAGPTIYSITADLVATDFSLSLDGKTVLQSPLANFSFSGAQLGTFSFIGGGVSAGTPGASFFFVPDFALGATLQSVLAGSKDPLGLLLNGSVFLYDNGDPSMLYLGFDNSQEGALIGGEGTAVPEPHIPALLALAGIGLGFVHRRRVMLRATSNFFTRVA
ncbi:MAG TPA: hypothetical protein VIH60_00375 [Steroidobacteraceae bacterium]|jgi:MYXO-CTERM domain-containing protein